MSGNAGRGVSPSVWRERIEELCAAYLADPQRTLPAELPWHLCDTERLLHVLRENKVPLLSLTSWPQVQSDPLFQAARQEEAQLLAGLQAEYRLVHEALSAHGIVGVLIKSVGLAPSLPFKSDNLDVLYRPQDVEQIRDSLYHLGYVELRNVEEPHKYLFRKFHAGRSVSAIHVHAHVGWMTSFLDEERLWQRCRPARDEDWLTIPAPEDALLTTLAHWFYEDKQLVLQDVAKYAHCLRQGVDWDEVYRIATWRGWRDGFNVALLLCSYQESALYGETLVPPIILEAAWRDTPAWARAVLERHIGTLYPFWRVGARQVVVESVPEGQEPRASGRRIATPLHIPFVFSKAFSYAKLWRDPSRSALRRAKDLLVHTGYGVKLRLHIHSQPAMLVTFSGVDGCGKTTQARALQDAFETCLVRADYTWSRGGSAGWIAFLNRWVRRLTGMPPPSSTQDAEGMTGQSTATCNAERTAAKVDTRRKQLRSPWKRWAWSWLTTIELLLRYTWRVTLPLLRGRVVICDRYVDDALADWSAYFGHAAGRPQDVEKCCAAKVLRLLTPRPSRAYWLDVPAEVAQSRSPDGLPAHFLEAQSAAYRQMASERRAAAYALQRLDGSRGWEEISDQVVYQVLSDYFAGYWTFINQLFWKNPGQWR